MEPGEKLDQSRDEAFIVRQSWCSLSHFAPKAASPKRRTFRSVPLPARHCWQHFPLNWRVEEKAAPPATTNIFKNLDVWAITGFPWCSPMLFSSILFFFNHLNKSLIKIA